MSSGGKTTTTNEPWEGAKGPLTDLYGKASALMDKPSAAPVNASQQQGLADIRALAPQYSAAGDTIGAAAAGQRTGVDAIRALGTDTIAGKYMYADSNPYLRSAVDAAQDSTWQNLTRDVMPAITSGTQLNGTYGGDRTNLMFGQAIGDAVKSALGQANQIYAANYATERGYQMDSPKLFSQANEIDNTGLQTILNGLNAKSQAASMIGATGDQQQSWDQAQLDAPWTNINRFGNLLTSGNFGTQSTSSSVPTGTSMFQGAVGGGALGYNLAKQSGYSNPNQAALIAAILGGASGIH